MIRHVLLTCTLAALAMLRLSAQDAAPSPQGPVVYPAGATPTAPPAGAPSGPALSSNGAPEPVTMPPADAATAPGAAQPAPASPDAAATPPPPPADPGAPVPDPTAPANPAMAPLQGLANAAAPVAGSNGKPEDIDDIRPPYFYLKPLTWLWVLLGASGAIALLVLLWNWFKPTRARRAQTAYDLALEKLEKARALLDEENPEPYAVLVSETVRGYLGQRFHTPSTRRTTEEFLRQMEGDASTPLAAHRELLRGFLQSCDLVKFAHYQPGREELEQVQRRAVDFVTATRPVKGTPA